MFLSWETESVCFCAISDSEHEISSFLTSASSSINFSNLSGIEWVWSKFPSSPPPMSSCLIQLINFCCGSRCKRTEPGAFLTFLTSFTTSSWFFRIIHGSEGKMNHIYVAGDWVSTKWDCWVVAEVCTLITISNFIYFLVIRLEHSSELNWNIKMILKTIWGVTGWFNETFTKSSREMNPHENNH